MQEKESKKYDYLCVGYAKTGTTTLWSVLGQHPQICQSSYKELFVENPIYLSETEITTFFNPTTETKVLIEATPWFLLKSIFKPTVDSVKSNKKIRKIKCIFTLRDHIKRHNSSILNCIMNHYKEISTGEIKSRPNIFHSGGFDHFSKYYSILSPYYDSMVFLEKEYGKENVLFLKLDQLHLSNKKINTFLEVEDFKYKWYYKNKTWNKSITIKELKMYNEMIKIMEKRYEELKPIIENDKKKILDRYGIKI
jgi:hypothetical protein